MTDAQTQKPQIGDTIEFSVDVTSGEGYIVDVINEERGLILAVCSAWENTVVLHHQEYKITGICEANLLEHIKSTREHIDIVRKRINYFVNELKDRADKHDESKLDGLKPPSLRRIQPSSKTLNMAQPSITSP